MHPARQHRFGDLYTALQNELANQAVFVSRQGSLELYHYSNKCVYDRLWNPWTLMARGLVLDVRRQVVAATPFPKFFNYGEQGDLSLPDEPFAAYEKVDGSLIIAFWNSDRWVMTTKGAFGSSQADWAARRWEQLHTADLDRNSTYLFEAVYRTNRIVVGYPFEDLVLLGAYDGQGAEYDRPALQQVAGELGCRICGSFAFDSIDQILEVAAALDANSEGFVIRFNGGRRVKIKGEVYRRIHATITNITPLHIWESLCKRDDLEAIRREIPEEFWADFDSIRQIITGHADQRVAEVESLHQQCQGKSDKELGLLLVSLPGTVSPFIFTRRKRGPNWHTADQRSRETLFRSFRPVGNLLPGYRPSTHLLGAHDDAA